MRGLNCQFLIQGVKPILYFDLVQGVSFFTHCVCFKWEPAIITYLDRAI